MVRLKYKSQQIFYQVLSRHSLYTQELAEEKKQKLKAKEAAIRVREREKKQEILRR